MNFLSNAIKFTYEGQQIIIRIVLLEVQDILDLDKDHSQDEGYFRAENASNNNSKQYRC